MKLVAISFLSAAFLAAASFTVPSAKAQESGIAQARYFCLPHAQAVDKLQNRFQEKVVGVGLGQDQKSVVELYVSQKGSWTILITLNNGLSCITAAGKNWLEVEPSNELIL